VDVAREGGAMSKARKARLYEGVMPAGDGRWEMVGTIIDDGVNWCVFWDRDRVVGGWHEARVVACGAAPNKASYWLGWSVEGRRLRRGGDALKMVLHRPALAEKVAEALATFHAGGLVASNRPQFGSGWLP